MAGLLNHTVNVSTSASKQAVTRCINPTLTLQGPVNCHQGPSKQQLRFQRAGLHLSQSRRQVQVHAAAAPPVTKVYEKEYTLASSNKLKVVVDEGEDNEQRVFLQTDHPGRLILHWGVEGGRNYKGGWRLPGDGSRPEGTVQYKERALQTPWKSAGDKKELQLSFRGDEVSDFLNFVIKDDATGVWYDLTGDNWQIPLKLSQEKRSTTRIPDDQLPEIPGELSGIWAYIKWEVAGCPNRSQQDSDAEYQIAIQEIKNFLREGVSLDELWQVAHGHIKYKDFIAQRASAGNGAPPAAPAPPKQIQPPPEELVGIQSYLLWEQAGKPEGADFSHDARRMLEDQLRGGVSVQDLERRLKGGEAEPHQDQKHEEHKQEPKQEQKQPEQTAEPQQPKQEQKQPEQTAEAKQPKAAEVGQSTGISSRNPLDLIKRPAPHLSDERNKPQLRPLGKLVDAAAKDEACVWQRVFGMGSKSEMLVAVRQPEGKEGPVHITVTTDLASDVVMHWGVKRGSKSDWLLPDSSIVPAKSQAAEGNKALDTTFAPCTDPDCEEQGGGEKVPLQRVKINIPAGHDLSGLIFVVRSADSTKWWNDGGSNYNAPVPGAAMGLRSMDPGSDFEDELSRTIVDCEVKSDQWTLMHRYNKAADLLDVALNGSAEDVTADMARIFVWLRYSAARKLTWQRNYNTQPRILGAAQERLTHKIAEVHSKTSGEAQEWVRAMLSCVGRGGNAQAVRDEILNIMHRNNIGEKRGTWMEDWHQKLHNNTTPDDVAICEAFIAFLESNGDIGEYWRVLSEDGIDRARLESFDRAIKVEPCDYPDKREALIKEFRNYLGILKAVHSGGDLNESAKAASGAISDKAKGYLGYVLSHVQDNQILPLIENAVEARAEIQPALAGNRELLYLDIALEQTVRQAAERGSGAAGMAAATLVGPLLQNLCMSVGDNEELCYCLKAWQDLPQPLRAGNHPSKEDALKAAAVIDRVRRAVAETSDRISGLLQPISTTFGEAFGVDDWAVELFSEEVVRGGPAFAVSLVLSAFEPALRAAAELGAWQIISPVNAVGKVVVVSGLHEVQDTVYDEPTVLLAKRVTGEEEVPDGAVAVLTPDAPDVLSHVSVRARNMKVLFAICHDDGPLEEIEKLEGKTISLQTTAAGGVKWEEKDASAVSSNGAGPEKKAKKKLTVKVPKWCGKWVVSMGEFADGVVGAKSKNIAGLRGKLPEEIRLPASVTVPFGSFEEALNQTENREVKKALDAKIKDIPDTHAESVLKECRDIVMTVKVPEALQADLKAAMKGAGIPVPAEDRWDKALEALKGVWASKFNERAFLSMRKVGLDFMDLRMAVLVQRVVPAEYAFVIHTHNPSNGSPDEIYCELVKGLGESIVSGMVPGSSLSYIVNKNDLENPKVLMYPSKSDGMFVPESLIFRSDSNGEDLEGYAGAGLYDSITMDTTELKKVDYGEDRLLKDEAFRRDLLSRVAKAGNAIEQALGSAQDVEGAVEADGSITVVQTRPQM
ncbi:hypothetical protein WJX72_001009 [[Myrmecia] bisecta]|uniref:Pyruvate phosphate dikinase AMP/ATP-binding domain-containing protein n=1 Tax=[Myrmecia] bisecta TaxID=41462 RepID=A0AAW1Q6I6_9CHLO